MGIKGKKGKKIIRMCVLFLNNGDVRRLIFSIHILNKVDLCKYKKFNTYISNLNSRQCMVITNVGWVFDFRTPIRVQALGIFF
jgi:hypothetical protein